MCYWKEGVRKRFLFLVLSTMFFMNSANILYPLISTSTEGYNFYNKSTLPNCNDSPINTTLTVLMDGVVIQDLDIIQTEMEVLLNITVYFRDNNSNSLHGANIELIGFGNMSETLNQYNYTLDTNEVGLGINILTIFAQLDGYQPQTFQFYMNVVDKATNLLLFVNSVNKTADPVIELPIGAVINITVKYYDNRTGLEIPNALVQLTGEGLVENLTENSTLKQYTILLDSSNLYIGVKLFTIVAYTPNYEVQTIDLRISINRIKVNISGDSIITVMVGELIHLEVQLTDLDFGGAITKATVTYRWANGQGILTDPDDDGIYEATLYNVPVGSYLITISAYAGDNYDFENFEIVIIITEAPKIPKFIIPGYNPFTFIGIISIFFIITIQKQLREKRVDQKQHKSEKRKVN